MSLLSENVTADNSGSVRSVELGDGRKIDVTKTVECRGLRCPRPQLMTKNALQSAISGDVVEIVLDFASSMEAIPMMLPDLGARHIETIEDQGLWRLYAMKD